ncbi:MAG: F0F1 ATP synthase subunit alpha [Candidatus Terrybacteria bacterium RIFCSPHIGHO2_01_FULL_58_15]|uniref:ATP synthase subunit alpha n=1 Tax=Terrybacteria sp. (strain RIFCSPHIGHO2_01_FULL_58_15) TaxID=1802363 RepID=A0A1G2PLL3_TERXR|nr:MAG: F0F1 ATP synthase subunit alpha [Candidatus Terrybacteria bacterium RIFCSPHIGHO2_01_FULL_58_15]
METREILRQLKAEIEKTKLETSVQELGRVLSVRDGVVRISGLSSIGASELLTIRTSAGQEVSGLALSLDTSDVGVIAFRGWEEVREGDEAVGTGRVLSLPVGDAFLGRVVNPLGEPLDGKGVVRSNLRMPLERLAPGVIERKSVDTSLMTGIKAIDAMIPIGRGQRELVIGDRQTGKTAIVSDTIVNQKGTGVVCIYVAIGQKLSKVRRIVAELETRGAMEHTIVVVASASDPAALSYIAPYAGCAMGEAVMERGGDALVIYDDLTKHAWAYRQIALLLGRPPGREAYPGDVFYLHSRLLERAAKLSSERGGGSLTALPIIETQAGDVSAYIPTNVISITDGQIYLESELFYQGIRPALNVGLSVSRVGSAAQTKAMKKVAGRLRLELAQYRELATFAQFAQDLDEATRKQIERGKRLTELLKQPQWQPVPMAKQVAVLYAGGNGYLDDVAVEELKAWEEEFLAYLERQHESIFATITKTGDLDEATEANLKTAIDEFKKLRSS